MTNKEKRSVHKMGRFTKEQWKLAKIKKFKGESDSDLIVRAIENL